MDNYEYYKDIIIYTFFKKSVSCYKDILNDL